MDGHPVIRTLVQLAGAGLVVLVMIDVFMTVLFARAGTGPLSQRLSAVVWGAFRRAGRLVPRWRDRVLAFSGPTVVVAVMATWLVGLLLGFTLLAWPQLGRGIRDPSGRTPTDLVTAFHFAGTSLTTVGTGDLRPVTSLARVLYVIDSCLGLTVITLTLSYIIQVYTGLLRRNELALGLHHASAGTGDAAALLAGLGPGDDFSHAGSQLATLATEVTGVYESHHFYSVLTYFRFAEPHYAIARASLVTMDLVSLIDSALDEQRHGSLARTASVTQLREGGMHLLSEVADVYLPSGHPRAGAQDAATAEQWRRRYRAAVEVLRGAGIATAADEARGAERYVDQRRRWDAHVMAVARYMEFRPDEIDPIGARPAATGDHREMPTQPLRAAG